MGLGGCKSFLLLVTIIQGVTFHPEMFLLLHYHFCGSFFWRFTQQVHLHALKKNLREWVNNLFPFL